jgi:glyoxylase-like metal-dependent hydrolase (beta-lactamase superfamily II)
MRATSSSQFDASRAGTIPPLEQVRDGIWALGTYMPGGHIPYSLLYLVRDADGGVHVIDPGWDSERNWQGLLDALAAINAGLSSVRSITATHLHPDHIGMAQRLHVESAAPVQIHAQEKLDLETAGAGGWTPSALIAELDGWHVPVERRDELEQMLTGAPTRPTVDVDRVVHDNERLDIPGFDLVAMLTPGHTSGSISLRDDANELLYTGDVILPTMHAGLGLGGPTPSNPLHDYLASLALLSAYSQHEVLPGHGYRFAGVVDRARQSAEHHLRRSREVAAVLGAAPDASIWEVASQLTWTAGWENLAGFYLYSALSQTAMHKEFVEIDGLTAS